MACRRKYNASSSSNAGTWCVLLSLLATVVLLSTVTRLHASDRASNLLPEHVMEMRNAILDAAKTGKIEELGVPIEMNELPPVFGGTGTMSGDPIESLRAIAKLEGGEAEFLKTIEAILTLPPLRDGNLYIWPYLVKRDLRSLMPDEQVDLKTALNSVLPDEKSETSGAKVLYPGFRIEIGADGTWHFLGRNDQPDN